MAEFAKCHICRALMVDDPDDRREHLGDHANTKRRIDNLGRDNAKYLQQIAELKGEIRGYGQQLDQHPISAAPESIVVNEMPDDEIDEFEDDLNDGYSQSTLNDIATISDPTAGEPDEDAIAAHPAIDRDDDLAVAPIRAINDLA